MCRVKEGLISIIIPTYNRGHLISETLNSITEQTYINWECIIIDDGSTDNTDEVIKKYIEKDSRFKYYHRPKHLVKGACTCRNYGFELSKGRYIKWFDSDDIMKPFFLEVQLNFLDNNKDYDFCSCQWEYFYENKTIKKNYVKLSTNKLPIYSFFLEGHIFATPAPLWRRTFLENKELFDEKLMRSQESDFHFRVLLNKPKYKILENFLFLVRRGHDSIEKKSSTIEAQLSVHYFFKKAFKLLKEKKYNSMYAKKLENYLLFRIYNQKYIILSSTKSLNERIKLKNKLGLENIKYLSITNRVRVFLGYYLMLFFKKGYSLIKLKKYDYRTY